MKILALRGENLASLRGEFSIDFAEGALAQTGLYAITGRTGAGKSTLLDAICLALYDNMPRINRTARNTVAVGRADQDERQRIRSNDVRAILSRGAASGYAEVDFIGRDGHRYRARWQVRRARNRADGTLQIQEMLCWDLDEQVSLGDRRTDVLRAIEDRIGLTWEQFRRSVLLAQGDFAAFLKADASERSALLERMTGTAIYSEISRTAHQRAKEEAEKLAALESQLAQAELLAPEAREALEQALADQLTGQQQLRQHQQQVIQLKDTLGRREALKESLTEAQGALARARQEVTELEQRRRQLEAVEQVQPLRPQLEQLEQAKVAESQQEAVLAEQEQALAESEQQLQVAETQFGQLDQAAQQAQTQFRDSQPQVAEARSLEHKLASLAETLGDKQAQLEQTEQQYQPARQETDQLKQVLRQRQLQQQQLQQQLDANPALVVLSGQQGLLLQTLERAGDTIARLQGLEQEQVRWQRERQQLTDSQQAQAPIEAELKRQLSVCQQELHPLEQLLKEQGTAQIRARVDLLQQQRQALQQAYGHIREWHQLALELSRLDDQLTEIAKEQAQAGAIQGSSREALIGLEQRYREAEQAYEQSRAIMSLAEHRQQLAPGEACPLCGAREHPFAEQTPAAEQIMLSQRQRLQSLGQEIEQHRHALVRAETLLRQLEQAREQFIQRQRQLAPVQAQLALHWPEIAPAEFAEQTLGEQPDCKSLAALLSAIADQGQHVANQLPALTKQLERLTHATSQRDALREHRHQLEQKQHELQQQGQHMAQALAEGDARADTRNQQLEPLLHELDELRPQLSEWLGEAQWQQLLAEPQRLSWISRQLQEQLAGLERIREQLADLAHLDQADRVRLGEVEAALVHLGQAREQQQQQLATLIRQQQEKTAARQALLGGEPVDEVLAALQRQVDDSQAALDAGREALQRRRLATEGARTVLSQGQQRMREVAQDKRERLAQWQHILSQRALNETELLQLLAHQPDWLTGERAAIEHCEREAVLAETVVREREQALAEMNQQLEQLMALVMAQEATEAILDGAAIDTRLQTLQTQLEQLDEQLFQIRAQLQQDEAVGEQRRQLHQALQAQQKCCELWQGLRELIGSADGSKFRTFAQSLTLESLLVLANHHLNELSPRYQLQRVPGADLALQVVDRDMGDEIRAVESLSGGESFLVSLALALGLASLSSSQTPIESLFIDEGFGTLDPDSLDLAIACLDSLQASGRQIGVISHVQTLVERIGVQIRVEPLGGGRSRVSVQTE